jgi:AmiR/NasT family two-component response regulator
MDETDIRVVQALADIATIALLQERAISHGELVTEQLQAALNTRIVIEQAKGGLAQIHGGTPDEAFTRLRTYCRANSLRLGAVAYAVMTDPDSVPELTRPSAD